MYNESNSKKEEQIEAIEAGLMPFGKYEGQEIASLPMGYVRYMVDQSQRPDVSQVNKTLLLAFEETHPKAFTPLPTKNNQYVSECVLGQHKNFIAVITDRFSYEGRHGQTEVTKYLLETGELLIHSGKRPKEVTNANEGDWLEFTAVVKGQLNYKEIEKQTLIKNLTNIKLIG
jgi:uncharacterized protein (DUF3820 family)